MEGTTGIQLWAPNNGYRILFLKSERCSDAEIPVEQDRISVSLLPPHGVMASSSILSTSSLDLW